jgi:large subunit ribosomal protein L18
MKLKSSNRIKIKKRIRQTIIGTAQRPRLSVFRSNNEIYAQLIDDITAKTLASASSMKQADIKNENKVAQAYAVGKKLADLAISKGLDTCVFDRNGYLYHGRIKSLAEGAREGGLKF